MKSFTKFFSLFLFVALVLGTSLDSNAYKRMVLIEEATNTNCGPCASQNPGFQTWINDHMTDIVPVVYHAWWPGSEGPNDPMYKNDKVMNEGRIRYYGMDKEGVPISRVNGKTHTGMNGYYDGAPGDAAGLNAELAKYKDYNSPYQITIKETRTGDNVNVEIVVKADANLENKKLKVVATEFMHTYTGMPNGESEFFYIARKMLPDYKGTTITLMPATQQTFNFTYTINSGEWNADGMYITAFIQDDNTKEVLQAANNMQAAAAEFLAIDNKYLKINANSKITKKISIKNPNDFTCSFDISIDFEKSVIPSNWDVSLDQSSVLDLAPGQVQDLVVTIESSNNGGMAVIEYVATPVIDKPAKFNSRIGMFCLSSATKYVVFNANAGSAYIVSNMLDNYELTSEKWAYIPFDVAAMQAYSGDYEGAFFLFNYGTRGVLSGAAAYSSISTELYKYINKLLTNGKKVFIDSEIDGYFTSTQGSADAKAFYTKLGITYAGYKQLISQDGTQFYVFNVKGVAGDPVSDGIDIKNMNGGYSATGWPYLTLFSDFYTLNSGSKSKTMFTHDGDAGKVCGIRYEDNKAKLVYLSFGLEAFPSFGERTDIFNKVLDYLFVDNSAGVANISTDVNTLAFGKVKIGEKLVKELTVTNTGTAPLNMTEIITDDVDGVYTIVNAPKAGTPIVVEPTKTFKIKVEFAPKAEQEYSVFLSIMSNAKNSAEYIVSVDGTGEKVINSINDYTSSDSKISISVNPSLISTTADIKLNITELNAVSLNLFDSNGNLVKVISNGLSESTNNIQFSASDLSSGKYYIIATSGNSSAKVPVIIVK